jgi:hypothetical protein
MRKTIIITIILSYCALSVSAQSVAGLIRNMDTLRNRLPVEKLYLQTDKPYYTLGDTLWFKSYLLNTDYLTPSARSGLLYLELDNSNNQMVKRIMVQAVSGISFGDIALDQEEIPEGSYTLRAYTNWMRNFGEDYIFKKNIYISALSGSTLVKASFKLDSIAGKSTIEANLFFIGLDKNPVRLKDMQLKVMNGRHNLFKDKATTGMDGGLNVNFDLADKTQLNNLSIIANQTGKGADTAKLTVPVTVNRPEKMDVQFMPEGGNLVAGIPTKVGFKAIGEDGKGADVTGKVINGKNQTITNIQTIHKGMGSFELTPEANESYTAVINLPNKTTKSYPLPKINLTGTTLRITNKGNDSLEITLTATATTTNNYYLIGQSRGVICYAATIKFTEKAVKKIIGSNLFPTGIARFTLLNNINQPLNERIVYIDHNDNLNINITVDKPGYTTRDSIALAIQVKDKDNNPVHGTFSLAVTDNEQVKPDSIGSNILNNLLFTSDLKGTVEEPGWYFQQENSGNNKAIALDNLLLTQGWVGYDWKNVFNIKPAPILFPAEKEFTVQGKVTNVFNAPVKGTGVMLLQKKPGMIMDTLTDDKGRFVFKGQKLFPPDTAYYLIEAHNKNGKSFNVGVDVDEFIPPVFAAPKEQPQPWYVNSDATLLNNGSTKVAQIKAEADYKGEGHLLKEVEIKDKKVIPGSHNLNGPGEADIIMDEKEMNAAKKMTLFELLKHRFKNFAYYTDPVLQGLPGPPHYHLNVHQVIFVIDGVFIGGSTLPIEFYMSNLTAEDVKGIEIMYSAKYAMAYDPGFLHKETGPERKVPVFLEITTYSGHGAYLRHIPGRYVYKPIGFSLPKQFYSPRYTIKNKNMAPGTDLRSTIHWEPNVITDRDGKATVSFFSADKPAEYTIIMEGTDLNGNLGYKRQKIKVAPITAMK